MASSDTNLLEIELLWSRYKERLARDPYARIEDFIQDHSKHADQIRAMFPMLQELDDLGSEAGFEEPVPEFIGRYPIVRRLGSGGMGEVFEGECNALRERVAIKVISASKIEPRNIRRFEQEARAVAALHHTNIVPIYEFGADHGQQFYTMRLVDGPNLAQVIRHHERASGDSDSRTYSAEFDQARVLKLHDELFNNWELIADFGIQTAQALEHAHSKHVLHRDIKPANLLVDESRKVWITDFGLAKHTLDSSGLTSIFHAVGTPRYMAPEQAKGIADERSDIYSLGVTLFELATMQKYPAESSSMRCKPRSHNAAIPSDLEHIIVRALDPAPEKRYQSATRIREDLEKFCSKLKTKESTDRTGWVLGGIVGVTLVFLLVASVLVLGPMYRKRLPKKIAVQEGVQLVSELPVELGDLQNWRVAGADGHVFKINTSNRTIQFGDLPDYEVPVDQDMDNEYSLTLEHLDGGKREFQITVLNENEAPQIDPFFFLEDGKTVLLNKNELSSAWSMNVQDDSDSFYNGLHFRVVGGSDENFINLTPYGIFAFDPNMGRAEKADADHDGVYEVDIEISDSTHVWIARLQPDENGRLALIRERLGIGAELHSEVISSDCLIRRDVIDFASADGETFYHIHPQGESIALYRSLLSSDGTLQSELLSADCKLPEGTNSLATHNGVDFVATRKRRGSASLDLMEMSLQTTGEFQVSQQLEHCGLSSSTAGLGWVDANRFEHTRVLSTGESRLYFSFFKGRFANMRLSDHSQYKTRTAGLCTWVGKSDDSKTTHQQIRFSTLFTSADQLTSN